MVRAMRALLLVGLVACSSKAAAPPTAVTLEQLIGPTAVGVTRQPPDQYSILLAVRDLIDPNQDCWSKLAHRMVAGYQVSLPKSSYFIAEGDLPRTEVEHCAPLAVKGLSAKTDGDAAVFDTPLGSVRAVWRGKFLVFGGKAEVEEGMRAPAPQRWSKLLATVGAAPVWLLRVDTTLTPLIGDTVDYALVIDKMERTPKVALTGRFVAHYATPDARAKGAQRIKEWSGRGKWPVDIPASPEIVAFYDRLAATISHMPLTETGTELVLAWDIDMFGGAEGIASFMENIDKALPHP